MHTDPRFKITYTLTAWDYAAMARALTRRPWQRSIVTVVLWLFSVWCLLVFYTDLYNPVTMVSVVVESGSWLWVFGCIGLVALLSLATHWLAWGASFLYYRQIASANATITMTLSDDAVRVTSSVADSTVPWTTVKRVIREKSYLMLPISKREAFILPRRGFETEESFNDAWRYASKQISAGLA
ncbi:hypothetical protein ABIA10_006391 [Rhizobium leguminosarum]